jgi:non-specific protein-tyrosine kinase
MTAKSGSMSNIRYETNYTDRLMNTYIKIATSAPVKDQLKEKFELNDFPEIDVDILANTELMRITVEADRPALATNLANGLAEILINQSFEEIGGGAEHQSELLSLQLAQIEEEMIQAKLDYESLIEQFPEGNDSTNASLFEYELKKQIYTTLLEQYEGARFTESLQSNTITLIDPAVIPSKPSKPNLLLNIALGAIVGLIGGLGLAFLFEYLDTTLYTTEQIEDSTSSRIIGKIPFIRKRDESTLLNRSSPQGEAFRHLRTNIFAYTEERAMKALLVTSSERGEGKSTIVAGLAQAIAQDGLRVIVVDCDLRVPTMQKIYDLPNLKGVTSVLMEKETLENSIQEGHLPGVNVLTSGPLPTNPAELIGSPEMKKLIGKLTNDYDLVLLDSPAYLSVADAAIIARMVDGVILVTSQARITKEKLLEVVQQLEYMRANNIGIVVNRADHQFGYYEV